MSKFESVINGTVIIIITIIIIIVVAVVVNILNDPYHKGQAVPKNVAEYVS